MFEDFPSRYEAGAALLLDLAGGQPAVAQFVMQIGTGDSIAGRRRYLAAGPMPVAAAASEPFEYGLQRGVGIPATR